MTGSSGIHLAVEDLGCDRGGHPLFRGVSLALAPGDVLEIHGRNGVGKSSLLRQIAGLITPAAGKVRWAPARGGGPQESDWQDGAPHDRLRLLSHKNALKPDLSALENLVFWARMDGVADVGAGRALEQVRLGEAADRPARALSAGQQRRVSLARLLLAPRDLWLLDEPTAALDRASEEVVGALIEAHRSSGGSAVIATHKVLPVEAKALRFE